MISCSAECVEVVRPDGAVEKYPVSIILTYLVYLYILYNICMYVLNLSNQDTNGA